MTIKEMQYEFNKRLEIIQPSTATTPPSTSVLLSFLNDSQTSVLTSTYLAEPSMSANVRKILREDGLRNLIARTTIVAQPASSNADPLYGTGSTIIGYYADISDLSNFLYYVRSESLVDKDSAIDTSGTYEWVTNELSSFDDMDKYLTTAYNKPSIPNPKVFMQSTSGSEIIILIDETTSLRNGITGTINSSTPDTTHTDDYVVTGITNPTTFTIAGYTAQVVDDRHNLLLGDTVNIAFIGGGTGTLSTTLTDNSSGALCLAVTYLRYPKTLVFEISDSDTETLTCELPEYLHIDVVKQAVEFYVTNYKYKLSERSN